MTANFCIVNQNTELGGNDFGIDDIALFAYYTFIDSITVTFVPPPEIDLGTIFKSASFFLLACIVCTIILIIFPQVVLVIPNMAR